MSGWRVVAFFLAAAAAVVLLVNWGHALGYDDGYRVGHHDGRVELDMEVYEASGMWTWDLVEWRLLNE